MGTVPRQQLESEDRQVKTQTIKNYRMKSLAGISILFVITARGYGRSFLVGLNQELGDNTSSPESDRSESRIIFRDQFDECAPDCGGQPYCEHPTCYPEEDILHILNETKLPEGLFDEPSTRKARAVDETAATVNHIKPRVAKDVNGVYRFILNTASVPQLVSLEECSPGQLAGQHGQHGDCRQVHRDTWLATVATDGNVAWDRFSFPSRCSCGRQL